MASSFWILLVFIAHLMVFPLLSSTTPINSLPSTTASTSPTFPTNFPPLSPFQELSPEIAPLLPSPGGVLPSPTESSIPTIPSNPSPPNPDELAVPGPYSAISPLGLLPASSAEPQHLISLVIAFGCWLVQVL
ncbi:hypothetical protein Tsubulata_018298 [Turnera subulata]|uniref:Uncharacterized protein n=1 Tax=Turnera subulata TaxID=218843 RepID=A0A9Q0JL28_9ROSI|nr:hypothetical protein Tsubulata_018298 [Turnera subulata]